MEYNSEYFLKSIQNLKLICSISGCKTVEELFSEREADIRPISKSQGRDK